MLRKAVGVAASIVIAATSMTVPVWAEQAPKTYVLDLHEAMDMAIEYSQDIKDIESQKITLNETLRSGLSTKNQIVFVVEDYEDFVDKWNDEDERYDKYKDLSVSELQETYIDLNMSLARASVYLNTEKTKQVNRDIEFIKYMFMFGTDEPDLTKEEIYLKYEKNALLAERQSQIGVEKTLNMIDMIEGNLENGVLQLYDTIQTIEDGIEVSEDNLSLQKDINSDYSNMYDQGQISLVEKDINGLELSQQELELSKLQLQNEMAQNAFKALLGLQPNDRIVLSEEVDTNNFLDGVSLEKEIEQAQSVNTDLIAYELDYDLIKANYDLYMDYSGRLFGSEYEDLSDSLEEAELNLRDQMATIESNVRSAYNDILSKIQELNANKKGKENAEASLIHAMQSKKLGLITQTQLNGARLQYQAAVNSVKTSERTLQSAIMKYDILLEKGILYK